MKNRDPPKPHILKEASNDMLAELPIFASIFQYFFMFLPERLPDFILFIFSGILLAKPDFGPPLGAQLGPKWRPKFPNWSQKSPISRKP